MYRLQTVFVAIVLALLNSSFAADRQIDAWWLTPHRMLQTNLREIDATMDIDQYIRDVQEFGANVVLFNVGGIVANYPTELDSHWRNTFMEGDLVGRILPRLHAAGIKMMGRFDFSRLNENIAAKHPDWLYVSEKGEHVNYNGQVHTCLMGGYQKGEKFKILREALTRYRFDGVFFNMHNFVQRDYSNNYHGICQCQNCKTSFKEHSGLDLPKHDGDSETLVKYKQWQQIQVDRQFQRVREVVKSIREDIPICTYSREYVDVIRNESNEPLGRQTWKDTHRAQWTLLTTQNKQLTNAAVHFYAMTWRHPAVPAHLQTRRLWQQVVNGAWLDFYFIGPQQRLEDRSSIKPVMEVFRFHHDNEKWMLHTGSAAEVGLVYHDGDDYWGWVQILSENHIPYALVSFDHSDLKQYKTVVVPDSGRVNRSAAAALDAYVKQGGRLLLSGKMPDSLTCLGAPTLKKTWPQRHSMYVRIRPEDKARLDVEGLKDYDLVHLRGNFYEYEPTVGSQSLMRLIHDVTYGPPEKCYIHSESDIPAMLIRDFGEGKVALMPFEIGAMYREWANQGHATLAVGAIDTLLKTDRRLRVETSPLIEVTHRRDTDGAFEWVALYNHSGHLANSFHPPLPVQNIRISLETEKPVSSIKSLKSGESLSFKAAKEGRIETVLPTLECYDVVLVTYNN